MGLFHKTFFYVIYSKMAVNYRMYEIMRKFTVKVLWNMPLVPCLLENFVNFLSSSKFVEERGENLVFPKSNFVHFSYFL